MQMGIRKYDFRSESESEKREYVALCERDFDKQLSDAVDAIEKSGKRIITLSGPTCSGKTTTARRFIERLERSGKKTGVISIDDYYYARMYLEMRAEEKGIPVDFDSVDTIDLEYLSFCIRRLLIGESFKVPQFDFASGFRNGYVRFYPKKYDYYLFEGIQAVYPEITSLFDGQNISVHISVMNDIEVNGVSFEAREVRLMRRLVRDFKYRAAPPEHTFYMWKGVCDNEDKHITPYRDSAEVKIDSFLPYEPFMVRSELMSLLEKMPKGEYSAQAKKLYEKSGRLFDIDKRYLPDSSFFHEFMDDPK